MLVQARPGYWHQAAAATLPRNCLLDLVKLCCSDTGDAEGETVQRTVLRFTVTSPARAEPAEEVVLETVDWIRWREVFSLWMVATTAIPKFSPEVRRVAGRGDGVTCAEMSGGHVITGHVSGARRLWDPATGDCVAVAGGHEGHVSCLVPVDLLHQAPYRTSALRHHLLVSGERIVLSIAQCGEVVVLSNYYITGGGPTDSALVVAVLADSYSAPRAAAAARYKRHQYGVVAVSVLVTTMAVLAR